MPNLKIRIETGVETSGDGQEVQEKPNKEQEAGKTAVVSILAHQALSNGKQILNYAVSNIANFTGDYTKTENIQFAMGVINDIATIGVGLAVSPIGAVVSLAGVALNRGLEVVSYFQDQKHKEIENDYLRQRSGNSLTNGSRGTED